mmetsp:Transcript_39455/g.61527  ORF Transcript_39455/g.61527 Transcript_39455/m.61527 type:complete len:270 (-) Transcript_39455:2121-2930(-)
MRSSLWPLLSVLMLLESRTHGAVDSIVPEPQHLPPPRFSNHPPAPKLRTQQRPLPLTKSLKPSSSSKTARLRGNQPTQRPDVKASSIKQPRAGKEHNQILLEEPSIAEYHQLFANRSCVVCSSRDIIYGMPKDQREGADWESVYCQKHGRPLRNALGRSTVLLTNRRCSVCTRHATYGMKGGTRKDAIFCREHRLEKHVDLVTNKCKHNGCTKQRVYGDPWGSRVRQPQNSTSNPTPDQLSCHPVFRRPSLPSLPFCSPSRCDPGVGTP